MEDQVPRSTVSVLRRRATDLNSFSEEEVNFFVENVADPHFTVEVKSTGMDQIVFPVEVKSGMHGLHFVPSYLLDSDGICYVVYALKGDKQVLSGPRYARTCYAVQSVSRTIPGTTLVFQKEVKVLPSGTTVTTIDLCYEMHPSYAPRMADCYAVPSWEDCWF